MKLCIKKDKYSRATTFSINDKILSKTLGCFFLVFFIKLNQHFLFFLRSTLQNSQ